MAVIDGHVKKGDQIAFATSEKTYEVKDIGLLRPDKVSTQHLYAHRYH
jgi:translation elongation factor EF-4